MASEKIKGLTVKIGADTSDFIKGLKAVDKEINSTNRQANELQKGLQLEFDEGRFIQAQRLVQQSLEETEEKAKAIREQLQYLESTGGVDTDGYRKLQTELYKTENNAVLLKKKLEDINNVKTTSISTKIKNLATNLKASTVAIGAVVAGITKTVTTSAKAGGQIQDMADRLGVAAEEIQRYDYIALQSGVDTEQLVKSMAKARDAIGTGLAGTTNTATTALQTLFGDLSKIPTGTEEGFNAIIDKLSQVEDSTLQAYYANEIFGERLATNLIPLINNGSEKISQLNKEFDSLGSLTNEEVKQLADFDDVMNKVQKKFQNLTYNLGVILMPILDTVFGFLEDTAVPILEGVMQLLDPIIKAIAWIMDKSKFFANIGQTILGKGWLWGKDDKSSSSSSVSNVNNYNDYDYNVPDNNSVNNSNYEDNSTTNITINTELTGDLNYDTKTLADSVIKEIVTRKQAGR